MNARDLLAQASAFRFEPKRAPPRDLEQLLVSPHGFGLTTATPLQRGICRVADGKPLGDLAKHPHVLEGIGDTSAIVERPSELYIVSGSRVGKTLFAAAVAFHATQTVDVSALGPGDEPRIPILSLDKDKAKACYLHLVNTLRARPELAKLIVREGRNELDAPAVWIRSPSGRAIMVCVAAGKAAGNAVVSYFLAGVIFDEFCKMHGSSDAVVNFEDSRKNSLGRLLPGAQLIGIGSPWAPMGPAYNAVSEHHGRPTRALVVVRARGRHMNPYWWNDARIARLPADVLRTEEEALFLDPEEALIASVELERSLRKAPLELPAEKGGDYAAAMDPATRGNAWTLVIAGRRNNKRVIVFAKQWKGSKTKPLKSREVLAEIAQHCRAYGLTSADTDQWAADPLREIASEFDLSLVEQPSTQAAKTKSYLRMRQLFSDNEVEIPDQADLVADLRAVRKRVSQSGIEIILPKTSDGRHCDYAPSTVLALRRWLDEAPSEQPKPGTREAAMAEEERLLEAALAEIDADERRAWWER